MWLVYPVTPHDVRDARRGVVALFAASAVWYLTAAVVLAVWPTPVLAKVWGKFGEVPYQETYWPPFLALLAGFGLAGCLRVVGYRLCRNAAGAVGAADGLTLAVVGAGVWLAAVFTVYVGFSGFLALVTVLGTAVELRFVRFPAQLFGMAVSEAAVRRVGRFYWVRAGWLGVVLVAGLVLLVAQILYDIPRPEGSPTDVSVQRAHGVLKVIFSGLAGLAVLTLPVQTGWYYLVLARVYRTVGRLLDPNGPVTPPPAPPRDGHDLLKQVLHKPGW